MAAIFRQGANWKIEEPNYSARDDRQRGMYSLWRRESQGNSNVTRWYFLRLLTKGEAEVYGSGGSARRPIYE